MEPFFWDFFFSWLLGNQTNTKKIWWSLYELRYVQLYFLFSFKDVVNNSICWISPPITNLLNTHHRI